MSPALCLSSEVTGAGASHDEYWRLRRGEENGANLRRRLLQSGTVHFYEGERGVERLVREEFADGDEADPIEALVGRASTLYRRHRRDWVLVQWQGVPLERAT